MRQAIVITLVCVLFSSTYWTSGSVAQSPPAGSGVSSGQEHPKVALPLFRQYEYLFSRIAILHTRASFREQRDSIDGSLYRSLIPVKLNLTSQEAADLEEIAFNCLADAKIMALSGFPHSFLSAPSNSAANSNLLTLG